MKVAEMFVVNSKDYAGFTVQGYLDETHGWIRLSKNGDLRLYFYESKKERVLEGNMVKSKLAKEQIAKACKALSDQIKAQ